VAFKKQLCLLEFTARMRHLAKQKGKSCCRQLGLHLLTYQLVKSLGLGSEVGALNSLHPHKALQELQAFFKDTGLKHWGIGLLCCASKKTA
jgi:phage gp16-like protein